MLQLRPTCEHCNKKLPPDSLEAMICSYECTFCKECVEKVIFNVCPNCGGGFCSRPVRSKKNWKGDNSLGHDPASIEVIHKPVNKEEHQLFSAKIVKLKPENR